MSKDPLIEPINYRHAFCYILLSKHQFINDLSFGPLHLGSDHYRIEIWMEALAASVKEQAAQNSENECTALKRAKLCLEWFLTSSKPVAQTAVPFCSHPSRFTAVAANAAQGSLHPKELDYRQPALHTVGQDRNP